MPTPASVGGPPGLIDFVSGRNRAVVQNRCEPVEVRFRSFGVVARGRKGEGFGLGPGGHTVAINPYTRLKPTPAPVGGPLGLIDFVFGRNRAVVQNRCEPVEERFRIFGVVVKGRKG